MASKCFSSPAPRAINKEVIITEVVFDGTRSKGWCCDCKHFSVTRYGNSWGLCDLRPGEAVTGMHYHDNCCRWVHSEFEPYSITDDHNSMRCLK